MRRFKNIVFVCNPDEIDNTQFKQAIRLAQSNLAKLTVVGYFNQSKSLSQNLLNSGSSTQELRKFKYDQLSQYVHQFNQETIPEIKIFSDKPFIEIIQEVIKYDRDLLIKPIGKHKGLRKVIYSSLDLKLLRNCPCPVWLIKSTEQKGEKELVVALDYEPENPENNELNTEMLAIATSLALSEFSELHVVHAWELEYESYLRSVRAQNTKQEVDAMYLEEQDKRKIWLSKKIKNNISPLGSTTRSYLKPKLHVINGSADNVIPELVKNLEPELLIIGTIGRSGIPGYLIGNTAETILNSIDCSVLTVKPKKFICPISLD